MSDYLSGRLVDLDRDGFPACFWPGGFADVPAGIVGQDYDGNDADPPVH